MTNGGVDVTPNDADRIDMRQRLIQLKRLLDEADLAVGRGDSRVADEILDQVRVILGETPKLAVSGPIPSTGSTRRRPNRTYQRVS